MITRIIATTQPAPWLVERVRAGWHWASDYAMGRQLAEHLWKHFDEKGLT